MNLTEDELVTLGIYCNTLLENEHWQRVLSIFEHQQFAAFISSDPKAVKEREYLYTQFAGVQSLLGTMGDLVKQAAAIEEQHSAPSSEDDDVLTQEIDN